MVVGHAYGLIAAKEVTDKNGSQVKIVNLRNPWGQFEWKGAWGDDSEEWTPESKEKASFVNKDDGSFWMSYDDFTKHYARF